MIVEEKDRRWTRTRWFLIALLVLFILLAVGVIVPVVIVFRGQQHVATNSSGSLLITGNTEFQHNTISLSLLYLIPLLFTQSYWEYSIGELNDLF